MLVDCVRDGDRVSLLYSIDINQYDRTGFVAVRGVGRGTLFDLSKSSKVPVLLYFKARVGMNQL